MKILGVKEVTATWTEAGRSKFLRVSAPNNIEWYILMDGSIHPVGADTKEYLEDKYQAYRRTEDA